MGRRDNKFRKLLGLSAAEALKILRDIETDIRKPKQKPEFANGGYR